MQNGNFYLAQLRLPMVGLHRVNIVIDDGLFHPWVVKRLFVDASQYLFYFWHRRGIFHF